MTTTARPMTVKAQKEQDKQAAIAVLREAFRPGSTVYTVLRRVSRSGMLRHISVIGKDERGEPTDYTWAAARALGITFDRDTGGLRVSGCGMDMGFHVAYELSHRLYREGFDCVGEGDGHGTRCPSNDHSNGDRDYTPHRHNDGGYCLHHRWL